MSRVFSGIQPTGDGVHLGNYLGAMVGMLDLQERHECILAVVDLHAMTVPYDPKSLPGRVLAVATDYLAAGIDPERSTLMVQSDVLEHTELCWILSSQTTVQKLAQLPTYKDKLARHGVAGLGLLSYPVLMAADILLYKAELVPVGKDQLPHIEFAREVARSFNRSYGEVFPEPQAYQTGGTVVPSLTGKGAMSKSVPGSYIALGDEPELIAEKLAHAVTDPARQRRTDKGEPTRCNVYALHTLYASSGRQKELAEACRNAQIGCLECKAELAQFISAELAPIRERRKELLQRPRYVLEVLEHGANRARPLARETMDRVRRVTGLTREID